MSDWMTHSRIADIVCAALPLDKTAFAVGSVAPDCNIENADWTAFVPPREVTHFMRGKNKLTADCEGFYAQYIAQRAFDDPRARSYLCGYYAHLCADVAYGRFLRSTAQLDRMCARLHIASDPRDDGEARYQALKKTYSWDAIARDAIACALEYTNAHPEGAYKSILCSTRDYPDYSGLLPQGGIARKLRIITSAYDGFVPPKELMFMTANEYDLFTAGTAEGVIRALKA